MHEFGTEPLPARQRAFGRDRMCQAPDQAKHDQDEDREAHGNMQRHGDAGLHPSMEIRHQPADQILHDQQGDDQPVKHLGRGAVLQTSGHEVSRKKMLRD